MADALPAASGQSARRLSEARFGGQARMALIDGEPSNHATLGGRLATRRHGALAMLLMGLVGGASAEIPQDRHWAQLEYFFSTIRSTARLDPTTTSASGRVVSLEDDLGLDDRKGTPYLLLGTRLGERGRLEFEYYQLDRDATVVLDREVTWGDVVYPVAAQVSSVLDTTIYRLIAGYSLQRTSQAEFGIALGLHVTHFAVSLAGQGTAASGVVFQSDRRTELVPLPTLGLYGTFMPSERWMLRGRVDYLSLD